MEAHLWAQPWGYFQKVSVGKRRLTMNVVGTVLCTVFLDWIKRKKGLPTTLISTCFLLPNCGCNMTRCLKLPPLCLHYDDNALKLGAKINPCFLKVFLSGIFVIVTRKIKKQLNLSTTGSKQVALYLGLAEVILCEIGTVIASHVCQNPKTLYVNDGLRVVGIFWTRCGWTHLSPWHWGWGSRILTLKPVWARPCLKKKALYWFIDCKNVLRQFKL